MTGAKYWSLHFKLIFWPNWQTRQASNLKAVFFETGAMPVPTKSRNPTICG